MRKIAFALISALLIFTSCNIENIRKEDKRFFIEKASVSVLPFDNMSNDITAETMMRNLVSDAFKKKGWIVIPDSEVDEKLKNLGITDGGQLNSVDPKEISLLLSSRYLCYGSINDFKFQNLGFIIRKNVELNIRIYDSKEGRFVFDETSNSSDTKIYLNKDEAKEAFIKYNALKLVENIMKRPLYEQAVDVVNKIFAKF
ncbi:MAG: GNA1162 family protein [Elusimicrobiales bacterium]